jgi:hypothetical protein
MAAQYVPTSPDTQVQGISRWPKDGRRFASSESLKAEARDSL